MRTFASVLAFVAATTAFAPAQSVSDLAPADEYFGHTKISILEIRHRAQALKNDLHKARHRPNDIEHDADAIDDAFFDWTRRYPKDVWAARAGWELATLYEELPGSAARDKATDILRAIVAQYPGSQFADLGKRDLARGIGIRPWPHWAGAEPRVVIARAVATAHPTQPRATAGPPRANPTPANTAKIASPTATPAASIAVTDDLLESTINAKHALRADTTEQVVAAAHEIERRIYAAASGPNPKAYPRTAWELATLFEMLPGEQNRESAIRMLAFVVDRYAHTPYGDYALGDLKRGVGQRE